MNRTLLFFIFILLLSSCNNHEPKKAKTDAFDKLDMMNADRAFSKMSEEKGMKAAFIEYLDSNGVLLRPGYLPIAGADAIDYLIQQNDTGYSISWEPRNGSVARSGDLGYTYGIYALRPTDKDTTIYGTYISIWKKTKDGKWKYILDSGNEGIETLEDEQ